MARLAEESVRDRNKIGNVLRAYIRENSWSGRAGNLVTKLTWKPESAWSWSRYPHSSAPEKETLAAKLAWIKTISAQTEELERWAGELVETRVDVNEAADALSLQGPPQDPLNKPVLYECLFVDRPFSQNLLSLINFKRCTFIRCSFDATDCRFEIDESLIVDSRFSGSNSDIELSFCQISKTHVRGAEKSSVGINFCEVFSTRLSGDISKLFVHNSTLFDTQLNGRRHRDDTASMRLVFDDCMIVRCKARGLRLSADSDISFGPIPEIDFNRMDLSAVSRLDPETLAAVKASEQTIHPAHLPRPDSWPPYSPPNPSGE